MPLMTAREERWPLASAFVISRGAKTEARVVVVELRDGAHLGRGEAVPYARYGETVEGVLDEIEAVRDAVESDLDRDALQDLLPPGAARNALDCALWDLEAKRSGARAWTRAGFARLDPVKTCYTLSLAAPDAMAAAARAAAGRPMLKLKIGGADDLGCVAAVRAAAPKTRLVVDANEALSFDDLRRLAPEFAKLGVLLIEQPLKAGEDEELEDYDSPVPLCADESLHTRQELAVCASPQAGGPKLRPRDHGGLYGGDVLGYGPGPLDRPGRHRGRSRRPLAPGSRPHAGPYLYRLNDRTPASGALGMTLGRLSGSAVSYRNVS
jgi:L-alanine-DL-glutamate epimerase-like enolase superfamily enzyme